MARRRVEITAGILLFAFAGIAAAEGAPDPARWGAPAKENVVSADEVRKRQAAGENLLILDARGKAAFDAGHVDGAVLALPPRYYEEAALFAKGTLSVSPDPRAALVEAMRGVPKDKKIITYCNAGCAAATALLGELKGLGFTSVWEMEGGYQTWAAVGSP